MKIKTSRSEKREAGRGRCEEGEGDPGREASLRNGNHSNMNRLSVICNIFSSCVFVLLIVFFTVKKFDVVWFDYFLFFPLPEKTYHKKHC